MSVRLDCKEPLNSGGRRARLPRPAALRLDRFRPKPQARKAAKYHRANSIISRDGPVDLRNHIRKARKDDSVLACSRLDSRLDGRLCPHRRRDASSAEMIATTGAKRGTNGAPTVTMRATKNIVNGARTATIDATRRKIAKRTMNGATNAEIAKPTMNGATNAEIATGVATATDGGIAGN